MHEMQISQANELPGNHRPICVNLAERELLTFISAVTELFGSEPARFLTELWLDELALMDNSTGLANCEWPLVTAAAVARLVRRLCMIRTPPLA
jgi:hypothetical protein